MSHDLLGAAPELEPKFQIEFDVRTPLARPFSQPRLVNDPVGLVVFADSTAIYLAEVTDPGAGVYELLGSVKANTYIHGWSVIAGWLYVVDGVEISSWSLQTGKKEKTLPLITGADVQKANDALADLQKANQRVEWATLLEQAEDEWIRVTAQQNAAPQLSAERDQLDMQAADHFRMLRALREMVGSTGGAAAARQLVAQLRKALNEKRLAVRPWCFSSPLIRPGSVEQSQRAVFILQGDGTLHACNKILTASDSKKWVNQAELNLALLDYPNAKPKLHLLGFIGDGKLRVVEANNIEEKSSWTPDTAIAPGTTHSLTTANKSFWWATDSGVIACEVDETGKVKPTFRSGQPWTTRQVGRLNTPPTTFKPRINPNDLFDTMNVHAWIQSRANKSAPLNDGMTAQLILCDASGKYTTPPDGTTYIIHGPFERDARSTARSWTHFKTHPTKPLVLLSDSRGASALCEYPTAANVVQLLPLWSTAPYFFSVTRDSDLESALIRAWPTPAVRPLVKPSPDMVAVLKTIGDATQLDTFVSLYTPDRRHLDERDVRLTLWYALHNQRFAIDNNVLGPIFNKHLDAIASRVLPLFYKDEQVAALRARFTAFGKTWDVMPGNYAVGGEKVYLKYFGTKETVVNFDPPWLWKSAPPMFHSTPPAWYDPWGYNRPGDFVPEQPSATYLDPFCFDGQLRFPQRAVPFDTSFKGRRWAVFTDNDPSQLLSKDAPTPPKTLKAGEPTQPSALVVTADEDRQRTTLQILPCKPLRIVFDTHTRTTHDLAAQFGSTDKHVVASPVVYMSPSQTLPVAWCVANPEFPGARLRKLAAATTGTSLWDKFVNENKTKYGPKAGGKAWQIDLCPLPTDALPMLLLMGYVLPTT